VNAQTTNQTLCPQRASAANSGTSHCSPSPLRKGTSSCHLVDRSPATSRTGTDYRKRHVVLVRQGKGNKDRYTPIGDRALSWIDKYLREARPKSVSDPRQPLLFITGTGARFIRTISPPWYVVT
jgi:hypothetical protein